jgi:hypothetical protein
MEGWFLARWLFMLYFQTAGDVDRQSGKMMGTLVQEEFVCSFAAVEYKNLLMRLGQQDTRKSICGALPAPLPFLR